MRLMILSVVGLMMTAGMAVEGAQALQSRSRQSLETKIEQLERQLRAVQRRVFNGEEIPTGEEAGSSNVTDQGRLLADLSVKIGQIERQMRELTGRLEELEYMGRQNKQAIESLRQEMDLRLAAGAGSSEGSAPAGSAGLSSQPAAETLPGGGETLAPVPEAAAPAVALPEGDASAQYQYAFGFVRQDNLDSARQAMQLFLEAHPEDALTPNAVFWLGRIYFRQGRDGLAAQQFLTLIDSYPTHEKRADALVDLADVLIKIDSASDACDALAEFDSVSEGASPRLKARAVRLSESAQCSR